MSYKRKKVLQFFLIILLSLCLSSCGDNSAKKPLAVESVKALSQLAVVEYKLTKIVEYSNAKLWGTKRILFSMNASIKAGIDLEGMTEKDITEDAKSITVNIPAPKILTIQIQPGDITELYNEVSGLRGLFSKISNEEKDKILQKGQNDVESAIKRTDILKTAGENSKLLIENWLKVLKPDKTVKVDFKS